MMPSSDRETGLLEKRKMAHKALGIKGTGADRYLAQCGYGCEIRGDPELLPKGRKGVPSPLLQSQA